MLKKTTQILKFVAEKTDEIMLFHSATGKDSIVILDLISKHFKISSILRNFIIKFHQFSHILH